MISRNRPRQVSIAGGIDDDNDDVDVDDLAAMAILLVVLLVVGRVGDFAFKPASKYNANPAPRTDSIPD